MACRMWPVTNASNLSPSSESPRTIGSRSVKVAAVALANKTARIVRALMMRADGYRAK